MRRLVVVVLLAACNKGGPSPSVLTADLTGAVGVGIAKPEQGSEPTGRLDEHDTGVSPAEFTRLVKLDESGEVAEILDADRPAHHQLVTSTHVVVSGLFEDIADADGESIDCYLVAIPRDASGDPVQCLLQQDVLVASYVGTQPGAENPFAPYGLTDKPGMALLGDDVYFVQLVQGEGEAAYELRLWTSGASETELLIHLDPGGGGSLHQPFTAEGAASVCVVGEPPSGGGEPGQTFCASGASWTDVNAPVADGPAAVQVGSALLVNGPSGQGGSVVSLETGAVTGTITEGDLAIPSDWTLTTTTTDGRLFAIVRNQLVLVDASGAHEVVDDAVTWTRLIGDGSYAWVYGTSQLRRFDRDAGTLDATNYLGDTGMLQVTDMSFSSADRIRIDGTAASGEPVVVSVDTETGDIEVTTEDLPRLTTVVDLL